MTSQITAPLREEHRELLPHVETLKRAADAAGSAPAGEFFALVDSALAFLTGHLIPHATAEEQALYPVVCRVMGAAEATNTMSLEHVEVGKMTEELQHVRENLDPENEADLRAVRRILYGLYTLVRVHFAEEEEVYLPLLDARLSPEEAHAMFEAMEKAAGEAKGHAHAHAH